MRYKLSFGVGFAAGYLLGSKAGRERYEQIMRVLRDFAESPTVQSTAGVLQEQATEIFETAKAKVSGHDDGEARAGFEQPASTPYPPAAPVIR